MNKPKQKKNIDWSKVIKLCQKHLDTYGTFDYAEDNDDEIYIFEEAMKAIFGEDVFDYINERIE